MTSAPPCSAAASRQMPTLRLAKLPATLSRNGRLGRLGGFGLGGRARGGRSAAAGGNRTRAPRAVASSSDGSHYYSGDASGPPDVDSLIERFLEARAAREALERCAKRASTHEANDAGVEQRRGKVYLIGTGPGDPGLLTLKAFHLMQTADVVLYDRLVSPAILDLVHEEAKMLYVGKQAGFHTRTQDEIEAMLLGFADNGATVIRLKGGDPLVFGRGGEEMETLMRRGHEVHIVPGVTAAAGVGSELGIPLTHRGVATSVRLLTGHLREGAAKEKDEGTANGVVDPVDFAVTSADLDTTLVVYMGLGTLPSLAAKLVESGFPPEMPAVAVERGTTPQERRVFSTIGNLPSAVVEEGLRSPTLIIVGNTVALSPWWPWHAEDGKPEAPGRGVTHVAQRGLPSEDAAAWFRENSDAVRKLRTLGRRSGNGAGEVKEPA